MTDTQIIVIPPVRIEGVDYSAGWPSAAALKAAGKHFVVRYVTDDWRGLKVDEYANLKAGGIDVALVYEGRADRSQQGFAAGVEDARFVEAWLKRRGIPATVPVYFAVDDFGADEAVEFARISQYLKGVRTIIPTERIGAYGSYFTMKYCSDNDLCRWFWQCSAWSWDRQGNFHLFEKNHLWQYDIYQNWIAGIDVDYTRAYQQNFGQISMFDGSVKPVAPVTPSVPWQPGDIGGKQLKDVPALAFHGLGTAARPIPIWRNAAAKHKPGDKLKVLQKGETAPVVGSFYSEAGVANVLVDLGVLGIGRARWSGWVERWPLPEKDAA